MAASKKQKLISLTEAAEILGVSRVRAYKLYRTGRLESVGFVGNQLVFDKAVVRAFKKLPRPPGRQAEEK